LSASLDVILNDRVLFRPLTGVGNYVRQLLQALKQESAAVTVQPFLSSFLPIWRFPLSTRAGRSWWFRRLLQRSYATLFRYRARRHQVYHEPNHIPIACDIATVTTVHDLSVLVHPEWHPDDRVRWYEREFEAGRRRTTRFIVASEFTRREMTSYLGIPPERMDVTYQAPRAELQPQDAAEMRRVRGLFQLPEQFFLYVGTLEPRKNVPGLLEAFANLPPAVRTRHPLVLTGARGWKIESISQQLAAHGLEHDIRLLGYVPDDALPGLYTAATALVWPSFYEGFGLPPLEAMACGCPVIVSNAASLPEVVGDAGVLLDPRDTGGWTEAMRRMAEDTAWRDEWRRRGTIQRQRFSWQRCAQQTIACYAKALQTV
jgi:alpha-1,3-rhamnosyl/mannosyltransferase